MAEIVQVASECQLLSREGDDGEADEEAEWKALFKLFGVAVMVSRNVRVYSVAIESRYLVVRNIPALGVIEDLLKRLSLYGKICEYRLLDHADDRQAALLVEDDANYDDEFTDTVWVQYETVNNARHAKVRGVQKPFYGNRLYISYAPHFESREDTADKLAQRRALLLRRARSSAKPVELIRHSMRRQASWTPSIPSSHSHVVAQDNTEFIGPQLPSRSQQEAAPDPHLYPAAIAMTRKHQSMKRRRI
ncbi:hypothetical protein PsorP6_008506 [Peronosclerospora sorghi]|uniref:Uncharacterized protein n=1 Tax=Peronosclerospora sorghi TaxID=230839 RepID=A0ACC0W9T8_9STRA|nr:hypothetical protein PsorP6_008506 [Peronosclerospora sorghi]